MPAGCSANTLMRTRRARGEDHGATWRPRKTLRSRWPIVRVLARPRQVAGRADRTHKLIGEGAEQHLPTVVRAFEGREVSRPVELDQLRVR